MKITLEIKDDVATLATDGDITRQWGKQAVLMAIDGITEFYQKVSDNPSTKAEAFLEISEIAKHLAEYEREKYKTIMES